MSITQFTTPVPSRDDPSGLFSGRANTLVSELPNFVDEMNTEIVNINTKSAQVAADKAIVVAAEAAAVAAANFKGAWSGLSGALAIPASVSHDGGVWLLLTDLADVTASEPAEGNADWRQLPEVATDAELHEGTANKLVDAAGVYSAAAPVALTDAATIALDMATGWNFTVTLGGNRTLANPTNSIIGQSGLIIINQDGTGGRTLAFGSNYKISGGSVELPSSANAKIALSYFVEAADSILIFASGEIS